MIVVHASFPIDPEHREEALAQIQDLAEQSRAEDGMLDYRATTDVEDENVVRFVERYEDAAAFGAHTETEHFGEFEAALGDWLAGEPEVLQFEVDSMTELEL
ncbi:putative quinol monooxygenase [Halorientalis halophila]|uniref:putative quinol monooxygenase n=1 Tax=Halorientalis halophila TaxID=3108499 RepID=UPI00300BA2FA